MRFFSEQCKRRFILSLVSIPVASQQSGLTTCTERSYVEVVLASPQGQLSDELPKVESQTRPELISRIDFALQVMPAGCLPKN